MGKLEFDDPALGMMLQAIALFLIQKYGQGSDFQKLEKVLDQVEDTMAMIRQYFPDQPDD